MVRRILKKCLRFKRNRKSALKSTAGEIVRDSILEIGIKTAQDSAYIAGNNTQRLADVAERVADFVEGATSLAGGTESAGALGKIAFKTTKDLSRGDTVCTGLCVVSGTCESVAVVCSTARFIPYRWRIYGGAKVISKGCMTFRNICAAEGC